MHLATGQLDAHVLSLLDRNDVPLETREAWQAAREIIHTYGEPVLTGVL